MKTSLDKEFAIESVSVSSSGMLVKILGDITFESVRDYLMQLLGQIKCDHCSEISTDDGLGTDDRSVIKILKGGNAYLLHITADGSYVSVNLSH